MKAEPVDQVVGESVQEQTKRVGQEAVTAEPVRMEAVLELFDSVLALQGHLRSEQLRIATRSNRGRIEAVDAGFGANV